jgi:hypothetical protein
MKVIIIREDDLDFLFDNFLQKMELESMGRTEESPVGTIYHRALHYSAVVLREKIKKSEV